MLSVQSALLKKLAEEHPNACIQTPQGFYPIRTELYDFEAFRVSSKTCHNIEYFNGVRVALKCDEELIDGMLLFNNQLICGEGVPQWEPGSVALQLSYLSYIMRIMNRSESAIFLRDVKFDSSVYELAPQRILCAALPTRHIARAAVHLYSKAQTAIGDEINSNPRDKKNRQLQKKLNLNNEFLSYGMIFFRSHRYYTSFCAKKKYTHGPTAKWNKNNWDLRFYRRLNGMTYAMGEITGTKKFIILHNPVNYDAENNMQVFAPINDCRDGPRKCCEKVCVVKISIGQLDEEFMCIAVWKPYVCDRGCSENVYHRECSQLFLQHLCF